MAEDDGALRFAERLLALLEATHYSATYKLATLLALMDVAAEQTGPDGSPPDTLSAREVGRRVIELYWPQTIPYGAPPGGESRALSQSPQNDIPAKLAAWRASRGLPLGATVDDARAADLQDWQRFEDELVGRVIGMPLAKLQRFGEGRRSQEDRFIYDFSWREEISPRATARPAFDDQLRLRLGVGSWLVRLAPLIRPLVQAKWAARVASRNPELVDADRLDEFLFGAQRISLDRIREPLTEAQEHDCFYCARRLDTKCQVDHFLPWSRYPDNTLDNLVVAHGECNSAKATSLPSLGHLERWLTRFQPASPAFASVAQIAAASRVRWL
ncbi:MAG TPA: HNH endonuclease domain-containing protein [Streptosporangiaceae bacterium]